MENKYFTWSPRGPDFETFKTAGDARKAAEKELEYIDIDGYYDVGDLMVCWGEIRQITRLCLRDVEKPATKKVAKRPAKKVCKKKKY